MQKKAAFHQHRGDNSKAYYIFIITIVCPVLFNHLLVQYVLDKQKYDAHVINLAGRQRMLSQKMIKLTCQTEESNLRKLAEEWNVVHHALQYGDAAMSVPKLENVEVKQLFVEITPHQKQLHTAIQQLLAGQRTPQNLQAIYKSELAFLPIMEKIVKAFEMDSEEKFKNVVLLQVILAFSSLLILSFEIFYVVQPAFKKMQAQNNALREIAWSQSHEARRPVANILGLLNLLKYEDISMTDEQKEIFECLSKATNELDQVIHEIVAKANANE